MAWGHMAALMFSDEVHGRFHQAADEVNLGPGPLKALLDLDAADPPSMGRVAESMRCDASWATSIVDALESAGYAERRTSPTDRRVKLIALTPSGIEAQARATASLSVPVEPLQRLSADEARTLRALLAKLAPDPQ